MPCPLHSYDLQNFCLSRCSCPFLQRKAPSCWLPLGHKAHQSTSIAFHFDKDLIRIIVYILLIIMENMPGRANLAARFFHIAANCNLRDDIFIKKMGKGQFMPASGSAKDAWDRGEYRSTGLPGSPDRDGSP